MSFYAILFYYHLLRAVRGQSTCSPAPFQTPKRAPDHVLRKSYPTTQTLSVDDEQQQRFSLFHLQIHPTKNPRVYHTNTVDLDLGPYPGVIPDVTSTLDLYPSHRREQNCTYRPHQPQLPNHAPSSSKIVHPESPFVTSGPAPLHAVNTEA